MTDTGAKTATAMSPAEASAVAGPWRGAGYGFGLISGALWGLDGVVLGVALGLTPFTDGVSLYVAPLVAAMLHDGFSAIYVNAYNLVRGRAGVLLATLRTRGGMRVCLAALLGGPLAMSGYAWGISLAGAAYAMAITTTFPAVGAILALLFLRERVSFRGGLGIAVSIAGAIVVSYAPPSQEPPHFSLGLALSSLATFGWGAEIVLVAATMRTTRAVDPGIASGIRQMASAVVYGAVLVPLVGGWSLVSAAVGTPSVGVIALAALSGTLSYLAYYAATRRIGVSRATPLNVTYALWGVVLGVLALGVHPTRGLLLGVTLAVLGAALVVTARPALDCCRRDDRDGADGELPRRVAGSPSG